MTGAPLRWRRALIAILPIVTCLDGCASMRHADAAVAPEFLGVWAAHGADSKKEDVLDAEFEEVKESDRKKA